MKFTIRIPSAMEQDWDIPGLPADTPDSDLLAAAQNTPEARGGGRYVETGPAFVYSRGEADFEAMARRWAEARADTARTEDEVKAFMLAELEADRTSERKVADALGVDRNTVRGWRGKARTADGPAPGIVAAREQRAAGINK